jgi:hypothetical protein
MAWPPGKHIENVITQAKTLLRNVRVIRYDESFSRAIVDLEGEWRGYRVIISEIHRVDRAVRYAYYVLDQRNQVLHAFDNSPDNVAIKQQYGAAWKIHLQAEVPHQHDAEGNLTLTALMTFDTFIEWLKITIRKGENMNT